MVRSYWQRLTVTRLVTLAFMIGCAIGVDVIVTAYVAHVSIRSCQRVNHVSEVIQQQGERGLATIGKPGGSSYDYYRQHPAELIQARLQLQQQIEAFDPQPCSVFG